MKSILAITAILALSAPVRAHRLDEYLQATRISIAMHRIDLAIGLTPGQALSHELLASIDPEGNARVPARRSKKYAHRVLEDLTLDLDGKRLPLELVSATFPAREAMEMGEGTIQLQMSARITALKPGPHEIRFQNAHLPAISVYLVNALLPENKAIQITRQTRDRLQKEYHVHFALVGASH